jgi:hypothetical protein
MNVIQRLRAALHGAMSSFEPLAEDIGEVFRRRPLACPLKETCLHLPARPGGSTLGR